MQCRAITVSRLGACSFALFVFAGYYKAADVLRFVPLDLTLLFWGLSVLFCSFALWRSRSIPAATLPLLAVFAAMAMGLHWPDDLSSYPVQKELRLYSLTALAAFAPLLLLREESDRRAFVYTVAGLGAVMAFFAVVEVARHGVHFRVSVFNANPILLARVSGFAALVLCLLYWRMKVATWLFLPVLAIALSGLIVSGTRGPLVAFAATVLVAIPLCLAHAPAKRRIWGSVLLSFAGTAAATLYFKAAHTYIAYRLLRLVTGDWAGAELARAAVWRETVDLIGTSPAGVGWGHLTEWVRVYNGPDLLMYPHNIFLEIAAEAGWLAAAVFTGLIGTIGVVFVRRLTAGSGDGRRREDDRLVFLSCLYWLLCAFFSGDVNDNRPLWAMVGMALAALAVRQGCRDDYPARSEQVLRG